MLVTTLSTCRVRSRSPHNAGYSTSNCTSACISYIRTVCAAPAKQHRHVVARKNHTRTTNGKRMRAHAQTVFKDGVLSSASGFSESRFTVLVYIHIWALKPRLFPSSPDFGHLYVLFNLIARLILELQVNN